MSYTVVSSQVIMPGFFNAWSLDATSSEELFFYTRQGFSTVKSCIKTPVSDYLTAMKMFDASTPKLRTYLMMTSSPFFSYNNFVCEMGVSYVVTKNGEGEPNYLMHYVKRPEFSVDQLALDLYNDAIGQKYEVLKDLEYDCFGYLNLLDRFMSACDRWWDNNEHYDFCDKKAVMEACKKIGLENNLQIYP